MSCSCSSDDARANNSVADIKSDDAAARRIGLNYASNVDCKVGPVYETWSTNASDRRDLAIVKEAGPCFAEHAKPLLTQADFSPEQSLYLTPKPALVCVRPGEEIELTLQRNIGSRVVSEPASQAWFGSASAKVIDMDYRELRPHFKLRRIRLGWDSRDKGEKRGQTHYQDKGYLPGKHISLPKVSFVRLVATANPL
jgi:hypothetical protein